MGCADVYFLLFSHVIGVWLGLRKKGEIDSRLN